MNLVSKIKLIVLPKCFLLVFVIVFHHSNNALFAQKAGVEKEIWQLENHYWNYLERNDSTSYKKLWINNQINYKFHDVNLPDVKQGCNWITELHEDCDLEFSCALYKKAIEINKNTVIIHYDVHKFWTDKQHKIYKSEIIRFSHTWIKSEYTWLLSEGIAIKK